MPYYLIVALQAFCIYHCYKNRNETFWYFVIFFIPVLGSIAYIIIKAFNKRDVEVIQNEITTIINPTKKVNDLKAKVDFADTFQNRINLADAYFEITDYTNALKNYKIALQDNYGDDYYIIEQIVNCYSKLGKHNEVIAYAEKVKNHSDFNNSKLQFLYGIALHHLDKFDEAEKELMQINQRYSNYNERLHLAKFLSASGKTSKAKEILEDISSEAKHMTKPNRKKYKLTIMEVDKLLAEYN